MLRSTERISHIIFLSSLIGMGVSCAHSPSNLRDQHIIENSREPALTLSDQCAFLFAEVQGDTNSTANVNWNIAPPPPQSFFSPPRRILVSESFPRERPEILNLNAKKEPQDYTNHAFRDLNIYNSEIGREFSDAFRDLRHNDVLLDIGSGMAIASLEACTR